MLRDGTIWTLRKATGQASGFAEFFATIATLALVLPILLAFFLDLELHPVTCLTAKGAVEGAT